MLTNLRQTVTQVLSHLEIRMQEPPPPPPPAPEPIRIAAAPPAAIGRHGDAPRASCSRSTSPIPSTWGKVPRNAPCPCGSGKKFKQCHGRIA